MTATTDRPAAESVLVAPEPRHRRMARHPVTVPVAVGLLGLAISLVGITTPSIWYDEAATIESSTRTWPQLVTMTGSVDAVHALYYAMMHTVFGLVGYTPLSLRFPSAVAVGIAAALVVVLTRSLGRPRIAAIAGVVFCLIPRVTWMGTEGRSYAITAALAVGLTVVFAQARTSGLARWWVGYALIAVLSTGMFLYLALIVMAHGITVGWAMIRRADGAAPIARRWAIAAGAAGLATIPFAAEVVAQNEQLAWIGPISPDTIVGVLRTQWFFAGDGFAIVAWALILVGVVRAYRAPSGAPIGPVLVPLLVFPTVALIAVTVTGNHIYTPRYLSMTTPFIAVVIAAGIGALRMPARASARLPWLRPRVVRGAAIVLLIGLAVPQIVAQRQPEAKDRSAWRQVADLIASERAADGPSVTTAIVYGSVQRHPAASTRVIEYGYPDAFAGTIDVTLGIPAPDTGRLWETHLPIAESLDRLRGADVTYLITSTARDLRPVTTEALDGVGWHPTETWEFTVLNVVRYERD